MPSLYSDNRKTESSPYLNRFLQPDTIIPNQVNPQNWNRYSYTSNNPITLVDPSGHDGTPPAGNQIQVNIALGLNVGPLFLAYYSLNLVTDYAGGVQLYFTKRDQDFHAGGGGFEPGVAEKANPTSMVAFGGGSVTWGAIEGSAFRAKGTTAFEGGSVNAVFGLGDFTGDVYATVDSATGKPNPEALSGVDVGWGFGGPLTYGTISTSSIPLTSRMQLPDWAIKGCKAIGQCGSSTPPGFMQPPSAPKNPPKVPLPVITPAKEYPSVPRRWHQFLDR